VKLMHSCSKELTYIHKIEKTANYCDIVIFYHLEVFKAKDVQDSNEPACFSPRVGTGVDLVHQPGEGSGVECL